MKISYIVLIFLVCLLPFLFYFARPGLVGVDTYANFLEVCHPGSWDGPVVWVDVLHLFSCNELVVKIVQFLSYFLVVLLITWFGFNELGKEGWKLGLFVAGLCPLLFQISLNFEAQWFGFVVGWLGFVLYLENRDKNWLLSACFFVILLFSCVLWQGCLLLLGALALIDILALLISIPTVLFKLNYLISYAFGNNLLTKTPIAEELPIVGATPTIFLWPFINKVPKKWLLPTIFLFIIGLIKVKYMFLAVPFLAMGLFIIDQANKDMKILGKFKWPNLILLSLMCSIAFGFMIFNSYPTQNQMNLYKEGIQLSQKNNLPLYNDWEIGWYIEYLGHKTEYKSSYPNPDYNNLKTPFLALTRTNINKNCETIQTITPYNLVKCI